MGFCFNCLSYILKVIGVYNTQRCSSCLLLPGKGFLWARVWSHTHTHTHSVGPDQKGLDWRGMGLHQCSPGSFLRGHGTSCTGCLTAGGHAEALAELLASDHHRPGAYPWRLAAPNPSCPRKNSGDRYSPFGVRLPLSAWDAGPLFHLDKRLPRFRAREGGRVRL